MIYKDEFTFKTEDIERVKKLYDAAAWPDEIANTLRMPLWYVKEIISLIKQSRGY